jgi:hypothetical protein
MDRTNMPDEYLIGDEACATIEPLLPNVYAGARRHDDRRIMSGIVCFNLLPAPGSDRAAVGFDAQASMS